MRGLELCAQLPLLELEPVAVKGEADHAQREQHDDRVEVVGYLRQAEVVEAPTERQVGEAEREACPVQPPGNSR